MLPSHISPFDNLMKEADEEASIPKELARRARPAGAIAYRMELNGHLRDDTLFVYDLELPRDFTPRNHDGEIAGLPALPIEFGADRQRPGIRRQPPRMGEHNAEVLGEAGFTAAEIAGLAQAGVIAARTGEGG